MRALNKLVKTLSKKDKGRLSHWVRCVRQRSNVSHVQAVEVARPARHLKPWRYLRLRGLAVVDLRSSVLLVVPCRELLVDEGSEDVGAPSWSTLDQLLHWIWDVDCEERALRTRDK